MTEVVLNSPLPGRCNAKCRYVRGRKRKHVLVHYCRNRVRKGRCRWHRKER